MKATKHKAVSLSLATALTFGVFGGLFALSAPVSAASLSSGLQSAVPLNHAAAKEAAVVKVHHFKRHHAKRHHAKRHFKRHHFKRHHFKRHKGHHAKRHHFHRRHHHKGKLHGHYRGHSPRHSYAARGGCHEVTKIGHRHGQKALIGGVMCYDGYGRGYVVKGSRYVIRYLHH